MKLKKNAISLLLVVCMVLSLLPAGAFAAETQWGDEQGSSALVPVQGQASTAGAVEAKELEETLEEPARPELPEETDESESVEHKSVAVPVATETYKWLDNDRKIEYPVAKTTATASSTQNSGVSAEKMLDNDETTKWEAVWNPAPAETQLTFTLDNSEYVTGFMYMSRQDNNIAGIMTDYKVYASTDGTTYGSTAIAEGALPYKLGTFFVTFDQPVLAKSIKIVSAAAAITELHLTYLPLDYDTLLADAKAIRADLTPGSDINQWDTDTLNKFDGELKQIADDGKPEGDEPTRAACEQLVALMRDLKRAMSVATTDLQASYRSANTLYGAAVEGDAPLQWPQAALDAFKEVLDSIAVVATAATTRQGILQDTRQKLEEGLFDFRLAQVRPALSTTLTAINGQALKNLMDGVTESRYQSTGAADNKSQYIELDYKNETQFESLTFYSWFAKSQAIRKIQVQVKPAGSETWSDVDSGKVYEIGWTSDAQKPSEKRTVTFDNSVKGTALRICVVETGSKGGIDELEVGISVDPNDMQISLDKDTLTLSEGETAQLNATVLPGYATNKNVTWTSSAPGVVSVSDNGVVKGIAVPNDQQSATVTITATTEHGGKTATSTVTLQPKVADAADKADTVRRVAILDKLAKASEAADYQSGALNAFTAAIAGFQSQLANESLTIGGLMPINEACAAARKTFDEASLAPLRTVKELINRVTGEGSGDRFTLEMIPADASTGMDVYEVDWANGKPVLRGNTAGALATAYNYYLKYFAYLDFPYVGDSTLVLPSALPVVSEKVRIVFPYEWRHYFNENCEYKYTTSLYGEEEWEHRLDWMAMNGFNMFLVDIGEHAIWLNAKTELGLDAGAVNELLHSNKGTEQYYGVYGISEHAAQQEGALAKFVTQRGFDLGMEPEIRPFVGQIPFMFPNNRNDYYDKNSSRKDFVINQEGSVFHDLTAYPAARWMNLPQGLFISPEVAPGNESGADKAKETFEKVSDIYYAALMETLGFDDYGRTPVYGYKDMVGEQGFVVSHPAFPQRVVSEMSEQLLKLNPDSVWMQTSWRYSSWLVEQYKPGSVMFVDLKAENHPKWNSTNEFGGTPWVWSMLFNFGGNTGLGGGFDALTEDVTNAAKTAKHMKGVSISPEGGDTNPALYALMAEMTWRSEAPDMAQWLKDYAKRRYGADNYKMAQTEIDEAWTMLYQTVYSGHCPGGADGPSQTLINAAPKLTGAISRYYGTNNKTYTTKDIIAVWQAFLDAAEAITAAGGTITEQFAYDIVDITRQALGDISGEVYAKINPAYQENDKATALKYADLMIDLCEQMDKILSTNRFFLLGTRLEDAKGRGVTDSDKLYFEKVERTFLTYWVLDDYGAGTGGGLNDYCNRHLAGLMTDYYGARWTAFRNELDRAMTAGSGQYSQENVYNAIKAVVEPWSKDRTPYTNVASGDSVAVSRDIMAHYATLIGELYPLDKTALQALYDANKDKVNTGNTAESWAAFQTALAKAKTALETATTQKAVDKAYTALVDAIDALVADPDAPNGIYDVWYQDAATVKPDAENNKALVGTIQEVLRLTGSPDNGQNDDNASKPTIFLNDTLNKVISATEQNTVTFDFVPNAVLTQQNGNTSVPLPIFGFYMNYGGVNDNYFIGYNGSGWNWQRYGAGAGWGNVNGPTIKLGQTYSVRLQWTGTHLDLFQIGPKNGLMTTVMNGTEAGANMAAGGAGKGFAVRAGYSDWYKSLTSLDITNMVYEGQGKNPSVLISGKVTDNGEALANATVTDGYARALTAADGSYTLHTRADDGATLTVTYPEKTARQITLAAGDLVNVDVDMTQQSAERPVLSEQPASKTVTAGDSVSFTVQANEGVTYQWQRSNDAGATWSDIEGATANVCTIAATVMSDNGAQFRCKVTASEKDKLSATVTSAVAALTVTEPYTPSAGSSTTTTTTKNDDGSTTKTVTNKKTGNVTETTTYPDGTKIVATTPKDGKTAIEVTVPKDKGSATVTIPTKTQPGSGEVAVILHKDGSREIIKTSVSTKDGLRVTLTGSAALEIIDNSKEFSDVAGGSWAADAIQFVASRELFNGTGDGFAPTGNMSRAMLFTVLARLDGQDITGGDTWYTKAMDWAKESGVSDGTNPEASITRESLAVMLYRYEGSPDVGGMALGEFNDAGSISAWAADAMLWCVENGIIGGKNGDLLDPAGTASRAEVAAMLQRFVINQK